MEREWNEVRGTWRESLVSHWLTELPRRTPSNGRRRPSGYTQTAVDLKCNTCHHIIPSGTRMPFRVYWRRYIPGCPDPRFNLHMNCTNCSAEMAVDLVDGKYKAVFGATQEDDSEAITGNPTPIRYLTFT